MDKTNSFVIEKKLEILQSIGNVTMLWWVTVVVLCLSVFGAAWMQRKEIESRSHVVVGGIAISLIFAFFVAYGVTVTLYLDSLSPELSILLSEAGAPSQAFATEIQFFRQAMWTAGGDLLVIVIAWFVLCASIWRRIAKAT